MRPLRLAKLLSTGGSTAATLSACVCLAAVAGWGRSLAHKDTWEIERPVIPLQPAFCGAVVGRRLSIVGCAGHIKVKFLDNALVSPRPTFIHTSAESSDPSNSKAVVWLHAMSFQLSNPGVGQMPFWNCDFDVGYGWVIGGAALGPTVWLVHLNRRHTPERAGRCRRCGYDLRATPDRCPECGCVPAE